MIYRIEALKAQAEQGWLSQAIVARLFRLSSAAPIRWPDELKQRQGGCVFFDYAKVCATRSMDVKAFALPATAKEALALAIELGFVKTHGSNGANKPKIPQGSDS